MTDHVLTEKSGGVLTLTLNRPEKKNALTRAMYQALADGIDGAEQDPEVRCVLIQAEGDAFTAGNDLADFAAINRGDAAESTGPRTNPFLAALARAHPRSWKPGRDHLAPYRAGSRGSPPD
jgi:enoyl-CoA hydratase/carnithine racemase